MRDECLDLDRERSLAVEHRRDDRTRRPGLAVGEEQRRRVGHTGEAAVGHLEQAEVVGAAEPVLHRAQEAQRVVAVAVERQHRVDHVLEHARTGDRAVLGDVTDEHRGHAARLCLLHEPMRAVPTWATEPGADDSAGSWVVWIESTARTSGCTVST